MHGLTVKRVEAVRGTPARQEIADPYLRGLYLIVQPSGTKTWAVRFRLGGKSHKHTIGPYPAFSLAQAREAASAVLRSVAEGRDPKQQRTDNVARAVEQFIVHHGKHYRPKPLYEARRLLQTYVVDPWGSRRLADISRADVRTTLYSIAAPVAANRTHSIMRKFFNWAVENDLIPASPVAGVRAPNKEKSRDRILTDAELRAVWNAELGYPLGPMLQILILTGQRHGEVAGMRWDELSTDLWILPKERTKNARRHEVPLSRQAAAIIEAVPRIGERSGKVTYVFTVSGTAPYRGKISDRLPIAGVAPWVVHDLRRTVASGMARLGVNLPVIEKILNHAGGSFAGIVGVYQRHEFSDEKRAALQLWADYVERLVA
jgi:integrase